MAMVVIVTILGHVGAFARLDIVAWDVCTRMTARWHAPDRRIVLVGVDNSSLSFFAANGVLWPWPRDMWARVIDVAENAGSAGVMLDIMFDDPGIDRLNSQADATDKLFADRLSADFLTLIAAFLTPGEVTDIPVPESLTTVAKNLPAHPMPGHKLLLPYETFQHAWMGLSNTLADADGVIRSVPPVFSWHNLMLSTLSYRMAELVTESEISKLALDADGALRLRYYGKGGPGGAFPYVSAAALITNRIPADSLKGRILIVGGYAPGLLDLKPTPVADVEHPYPGFEIHATALSNILKGDYLKPVGALLSIFFTLLAGIAGLVVINRFRSVIHQTIGIAGLTIFILILIVVLFNAGFQMPVASPLLACFLGVGAQMYAGWRFEGRQRHLLHSLFSRYLDDSVIEDMLDRPDELKMVGAKRRATILFTDMVGFTPLSEKMSPEETVAVLNEYHKAVVDATLTNRGLLDKYVGDAVMAIFGAPLVDAEAQAMAAQALLDIHAGVDKLSRDRKARDLPVVDVRVGMHTDEVVVGNIGHPRRMDYTAIGSGVNIASRLEGATRLLGSRNLVSEHLCAGLPDRFHRRELGRVVLKGLHEPLKVYEMITDAAYGPWLDRFNEAWSFWREGKRQQALQTWKTLQNERENDRAIGILIDRMEKFVSTKGEDDDVLVLASK